MKKSIDRQRELAGIVESRPAYSAAPLQEDKTGLEHQEKEPAEFVLDPNLDEYVESILNELTPEESEFIECIRCLSNEALEMEIESLGEDLQKLYEGLNVSKYRKPEFPQFQSYGVHRRKGLKMSAHAKSVRIHGRHSDEPESSGSEFAVVNRSFRHHAIAAHQHYHAAAHLRKTLDALELPGHIKQQLKKRHGLAKPFQKEVRERFPGVEHLHTAWRRHLVASQLHQAKAGKVMVHRKGGYWVRTENPPEVVHQAIQQMRGSRDKSKARQSAAAAAAAAASTHAA